VQPFL